MGGSFMRDVVEIFSLAVTLAIVSTIVKNAGGSAKVISAGFGGAGNLISAAAGNGNNINISSPLY